jgi:tripartite-type tricarboxylate transporter receptor subunit TctC
MRGDTKRWTEVKMKFFYFWPCSIFILVFFLSKEGVCQSPYYQGKTITFMQGRDPGGVGDLRNKVMYQFMQKYIPGHPTIISEYMPGGRREKGCKSPLS